MGSCDDVLCPEIAISGACKVASPKGLHDRRPNKSLIRTYSRLQGEKVTVLRIDLKNPWESRTSRLIGHDECVSSVGMQPANRSQQDGPSQRMDTRLIRPE